MDNTNSIKNDTGLRCEVRLLDIGDEQYGDSILCNFANANVLIDGAHLSSKDHIKTQLTELLGPKHQPYEIDLLIVTHAHTDHIGCLPELIEEDFIRPKWALVADPDLGWGGSKTLALFQDLPPDIRALVSLLREELLVNPTDREVEEKAKSTNNLRERYVGMLERLRERGCTIVRYGRDPTDALIGTFKSIGLSIPGPSQNQLELCAELIARATDALMQLADQSLYSANQLLRNSRDAITEAYRNVLTRISNGEHDFLIDEVARNNAAVNDQSIVSCFCVNAKRFLFSGDMQWSVPGVTPAIRTEIEKLLADLTEQKSCEFFKLAHHGSNNGFSEQIWEEVNRPLAMGICTGNKSKNHPNPGTLEELEDILQNKDKTLRWARTDHNGLVSFLFEDNNPKIELSRGHINDPSPNK